MTCWNCTRCILRLLLSDSLCSPLQSTAHQKRLKYLQHIQLGRRYSNRSTVYGKGASKNDDHIPWATDLPSPPLHLMNLGASPVDVAIQTPPPPPPPLPYSPELAPATLVAPIESSRKEENEAMERKETYSNTKKERIVSERSTKARPSVKRKPMNRRATAQKLAEAIKKLDEPIEPEPQQEPERVQATESVELQEQSASTKKKQLLERSPTAKENKPSQKPPEAKEEKKKAQRKNSNTKKPMELAPELKQIQIGELWPQKATAGKKKWALPPIDEGMKLRAPSAGQVPTSLFGTSKICSDLNTILRKPLVFPKWLVQRAALRKKFGDQAWAPRKKVSPDTIELIRALNEERPEYDASVLAEKFKVSPEVIRRILNSNWKPTEEERQERMERWLKRGTAIRERQIDMGVLWTKEMRVSTYKRKQERLELERLKDKFGRKNFKEPLKVGQAKDENAPKGPVLGRLSMSAKIL